MKPHQERVVQEKKELDERLKKLNEFFMSDIFYRLPGEERSRLKRQAVIMRGHSEMLDERIAAFQKEDTNKCL